MIGWLDAASGASGDMLLAALLDAGADEARLVTAVEAVAPEHVSLRSEHLLRGGLAARRTYVEVADSTTHRGLGDVLSLIDAAPLDEAVAGHAREVFTLLAQAEASVHGITADAVHFHEVGALDAIADIVGVCAGLVSLGLDELHCGPVTVGSGRVSTAHGLLSVPAPAVAELLRGVPTTAGPVAAEMCTPTGAALLRHWVTSWGPQPPMVVATVGTGAGSRDFPDQPNVVRLFVGTPVEISGSGPTGRPAGLAAFEHAATGTAVVYETNVDDLDPRLWPVVLQRLLAAGASDAWLVPIVMKKGRPAHTLSVLARPERATVVRETIFAETSAIGLREIIVGKHALDREFSSVQVEGQSISIKVARSGGAVVNVQPEYDDVVAAALELQRPVKAVLAAAVAEARQLWPS